MNEPCQFVILGATGHLARHKLLPALYRLDVRGALPANLSFIALARRPWSTEQWRSELESILVQEAKENAEALHRFCTRFSYLPGDVGDPETFHRLRDHATARSVCTNIAFYLALKPDQYPAVVDNLAQAELNRLPGSQRIILEKPFGHDLQSARQLNALLQRCFPEEQIYRIDHYLGKETVQNLLVFRLANSTMEALWNRQHVEEVQITAAESAGIEGRADYYEGAGALRDMVQNHLLQLLALIAMEPPAVLDQEALRDEKAKALRAIRPLDATEIERVAVRGQYAPGSVHGQQVAGYLEESGVDGQSHTETYAGVRFFIDNWRWQGVPFYLRSGKRLAQDLTLVALRFRRPPCELFPGAIDSANWVLLSVQPEERMRIELQVKKPGEEMAARTLPLDACYRPSSNASPSAYETLLLDVIAADRTLFIRFDEVESCWRLIDPIAAAWARNGPPPTYCAGSWGPADADHTLAVESNSWRNEL